MDTAQDKALRDEKTRNDRRRERIIEERQGLDDATKFEQWKTEHPHAVGMVQLPGDISIAPGCGCIKAANGKGPGGNKEKRGVRVYRATVNDEWVHFACSKNDKPGSGHT